MSGTPGGSKAGAAHLVLMWPEYMRGRGAKQRSQMVGTWLGLPWSDPHHDVEGKNSSRPFLEHSQPLLSTLAPTHRLSLPPPTSQGAQACIRTPLPPAPTFKVHAWAPPPPACHPRHLHLLLLRPPTCQERPGALPHLCFAGRLAAALRLQASYRR